MKNFVIYRSSAGSGKTYTLVKEYIRLALSSESSYRHILAVTFTNKAAEEMKTRIVESLISLSKGENNQLEEQLINEGVKGNIQFKAAEVLQSILHKYSYFSVETIDSFFHKIIRSFARELSLPLGYNIELDDEMVLDKITEELLDDIGTRPELTRFIEDFMFYTIDENKGWNIDYRIKELAKEIFKERYWIKKGTDERLADNIEKMESFITMLFKLKDEFENNLKEIAIKAHKLLEEHNLEIDDLKIHTFSFFSKLLDKSNYPDKIEPLKTARKLINGEDNWYTQKSIKKIEIKKVAEAGLTEYLAEGVNYYDSNLKDYFSARELVKTVHVLGIYKDLMDKLRDYRDENRLMVISDTNNLLMNVISGENSPFVYEKTGTVFKHFLIDEFQDTSTYQWKNFLPLVENSLAENNFSMIVGDVKQSIYRWRNGNMKLLLSEVQDNLSAFNETIEEKYLNENYRSKKEIIDFNNKFFAAAAYKLSEKSGDQGSYLMSSYNDVEQQSSAADSGGYVNITFIPRVDDETSPKVIAIEKTVEALKDALTHGYRQKDVMILTRNRADGIDTAHELMHQGFKVVSSESLLLTNSPKVKLLINILRYIIDKKDNIARTEILYHYLVYIKNESPNLDAIFNDYKNYENSMFSSQLPSEFFDEKNKQRLNSQIYRLSLYELIEMLIRVFKLNDNNDAYMLRFMEAVMEFTTANSSDISAFLEWWNEKIDELSIVIPEQEDAIRVMTIHKAKGLQSPIVILPCANWGTEIKYGQEVIWVSSDQPPFNESSAFLVKAAKNLKNSHFEADYSEECALTRLDSINMLYVAFTRASERLYAFVPEIQDWSSYNIYKLIKDTLEGSDELNGNFTSENDFEFGERTSHVMKDEPDDIYYNAKGFISTRYSSNIIIKSAAGGLSIEKKKKLEESKNKGRIIHEALSLIKYPEDAEEAINKLTINGYITADNEDEIMGELLNIFKMKEIKKWFSKEYEVKTESELILPDGSLYKPDRVLIKDKSAIIIDYKTGKEHKEHREQVTTYANVLSDMGFTSVEKYLFYMPELKIVTVED